MTLRLTPRIDGNPEGPTLLFIQGWPDDASVWDETVAALAGAYRCVRVTLPNFDGERTTRDGYETETLVSALEAVLREVSDRGKVTLILHDWGCYWGYAVHNRCQDLVARVAGLDIGPHFKPRTRDVPLILGYQSWLYAAFVVGGSVGDAMTRRFATIARAPAPSSRVHAGMNYPYRNIFRDLVSGRGKALTKGYWPTCPILFAYGADKPFFFHSDVWLDHVRKTGGTVAPLACGHWVQRDTGFVALLTKWLDETAAAAATPSTTTSSTNPGATLR
jgi:cis-3-alkyl-4-acyloxetan-2-one decarboxylase